MPRHPCPRHWAGPGHRPHSDAICGQPSAAQPQIASLRGDEVPGSAEHDHEARRGQRDGVLAGARLLVHERAGGVVDVGGRRRRPRRPRAPAAAASRWSARAATLRRRRSARAARAPAAPAARRASARPGGTSTVSRVRSPSTGSCSERGSSTPGVGEMPCAGPLSTSTPGRQLSRAPRRDAGFALLRPDDRLDPAPDVIRADVEGRGLPARQGERVARPARLARPVAPAWTDRAVGGDGGLRLHRPEARRSRRCSSRSPPGRRAPGGNRARSSSGARGSCSPRRCCGSPAVRARRPS